MPSRRRILAASTLVLVGGAGCIDGATLGGDTGDDTSTDNTEATNTDVSNDDAVLFTVSDGDEEVELATGDDVATVGELRKSRTADGYQVPITLTDEGATAFADGLESVGAFDDPPAHEIRTYLDGEVVYTASLGPDLAAAVEEGRWTDGRFLLMADDRKTAEKMRDSLDRA